MAALAFALVVILFLCCWAHIVDGLLHHDRVAAHVLSVPLPRSAEVVITISETDESITLGFCGPLVPDYPCFLHRWIWRKGFEERFIGDFTGKIADEDAEMCRIPFE